LIRHYFSLDRHLPSLLKTFPPGDQPLAHAIRYAGGVRIIRQPSWECLATFITSSLKQVPHIRSMSLAIRGHFGKGIDWQGARLHAYPSAPALAAAGENRLRRLGLGYRAPNLWQTARAWAGQDTAGQFEDELRNLDDPGLEQHLRTFPGVGPKIAHCAMLFGFGRDAAFPIDTWIARILRECYFPKKRKAPGEKQLAAWAASHLGENRGWAQQYLFHWARTGRIKETSTAGQSS
jgi:N-glycosylase/DNA lyase